MRNYRIKLAAIVFCLLSVTFVFAQADTDTAAKVKDITRPEPGWLWDGSIGFLVGASDFTDNWLTGTQLAFSSRYVMRSGFYGSTGLSYRTTDIRSTLKGLYVQASVGQDFSLLDLGFTAQVVAGYPISQSTTNEEVRFSEGWYVEPKIGYYCKLGDHMAQLSLGFYTSQLSNELVLEDYERRQFWDIRRTSLSLTVLF